MSSKFNNDRQRAVWEQFVIDELRPNLAVTLDPVRSMSMDALQAKAVRLIHAVQDEERGRDWYKWPVDKRPRAFGVFHNVGGGTPHLHLALHSGAPNLTAAFQRAGEPVWRRLCPAGSYWCEPLDDEAAYLHYISREFRNEVSRENVFLYTSRAAGERSR